MTTQKIGYQFVIEGFETGITQLKALQAAEESTSTTATASVTAHQNAANAIKSHSAAAGEGSKVLGALKENIGALLGPLAAMTAGFAAVASVKESIDAVNNLGAAVFKLNTQMGGTSEENSKLHFALGETTTDVGGAETAILRFSKGLAGVGDAEDLTFQAGKPLIDNLQKLGIQATDAAGHILPMSQILPQLADKFKEMPDGVEKSALALQLFGRGGAVLLPFLNQGADGIKALGDEAEKFGLVLDDKTTDAIRKNALAQKEMGAAAEGLQVQIGLLLLPAMTKLTMAATEGAVELNETLIPAMKALAQFMSDNPRVIQAVAIALTIELIPAMDAAATTALAFAIAEGIALAPALALTIAIAALAFGLLELHDHWDEVTQTIRDNEVAVAAIAVTLGPVVLAWAALGFAIDEVHSHWDSLTSAFDASVSGIEAVAGVIEDVGSAWVDVVQAVEGNDLVEWFEGLPGRTNDALRGWPGEMKDAGETAAKALFDGVKDGLESLPEWLGDHLNPLNIDIPGFSPLEQAYGEAGQQAGTALGSGIADGIDGEIPDISAAAARAGNAAANAIIPSLNGITAAIYNLVNSGVEASRTALTTAGKLTQADIDAGVTGTPVVPGDDQLGAILAGISNNLPGGAGFTDSVNQAIADKAKKTGGGGGGGAAAKVAQSAVDEFTTALNASLRTADLTTEFGKEGDAVIEAFADSFDNPTSAAKIPALVQKMVDDAKTAGVPNAVELGKALDDAIAQGLVSKDSAGVGAAIKALMTDTAKTAVQSLADAMAKQKADAAVEDQIGSAGVSIMKAFGDGVDRGSQQTIQSVASSAQSILDTLTKDLGPDVGDQMGTEFMTALNAALASGADTDIASLRTILEKVNTVMKGGTVNIQTGVEYDEKAVEGFAKALGISTAAVVQNIGLLASSGLLAMASSLDGVPQTIQGIINDILDRLNKGLITAQDAATRLKALVPGSGGGPSSQMSNGYGYQATGNGYELIGGAGTLDSPFSSGGVSRLSPIALTAAQRAAIDAASAANLAAGKGPNVFIDANGNVTDPNDPSGPTVSDNGKGTTARQYASGTDYVPYDMLAKVHQGERITPASMNVPGPGSSLSSPVLSRGGGGNSSMMFDFRGASLTGTMQQNEAMMRRVVNDALRDERTVTAFRHGVRRNN